MYLAIPAFKGKANSYTKPMVRLVSLWFTISNDLHRHVIVMTYSLLTVEVVLSCFFAVWDVYLLCRFTPRRGEATSKNSDGGVWAEP